MRPGGRTRGMTLVEVLLALAVFSVILLLLLSAFTGMDRARSLLSSRSREIRQIQIALDRIGSDLMGAFSSETVAACLLTSREDRFGKLRASTLLFTAFTPPDLSDERPADDLVKIRYFPRQSEDGRFLELRRELSVFPLIESKAPAREVRIAGKLLGFRVELFDGTSWVREWPPPGRQRSAMPARAAIVLTDPRGTEYRRVVPIPLAGQEGALPYSGRRKAPGS